MQTISTPISVRDRLTDRRLARWKRRLVRRCSCARRAALCFPVRECSNSSTFSQRCKDSRWEGDACARQHLDTVSVLAPLCRIAILAVSLPLRFSAEHPEITVHIHASNEMDASTVPDHDLAILYGDGE